MMIIELLESLMMKARIITKINELWSFIENADHWDYGEETRVFRIRDWEAMECMKNNILKVISELPESENDKKSI